MTEKMLMGKNEYQEMALEKENFNSELLTLKQEVMNTETKSEIPDRKIDRSLNYLRSLIKNGNYSELMEQNSREIVRAVQILLKNKGYKLDNMDGILLPEGKTTSSTVEAIKKFQRDNGLNDDGSLGEPTIKKILDIYKNWVTYEEYRSLSSKDSLTDHEFELVMNFCKKNGFIKLKVKSITDAQAAELGQLQELLSKSRGVSISCSLNGLESITDKQAEGLSKVDSLSLDGLGSITDNQAEELWKVRILHLNGLKNITDKQAEKLGKVRFLYLNGLESITDKQAEELGKVRFLYLDGLKNITDKQAEELGKVYSLSLNGLESITDEQAIKLKKVTMLSLNGLKSITAYQLKSIIAYQSHTFLNENGPSDLYLDGLEKITNKQAEELGKVEELSLNGLKSITDKQAEELGKVKKLFLNGLESITDKQARILSRVPILRVPEDILTQQQKEILKLSLYQELPT